MAQSYPLSVHTTYQDLLNAHGAALETALEILETAQAQCCDGPVGGSEVDEAIAYLGSQSDKAAQILKRFTAACVIPDQPQRFEATAQIVRAVKRQFGR